MSPSVAFPGTERVRQHQHLESGWSEDAALEYLLCEVRLVSVLTVVIRRPYVIQAKPPLTAFAIVHELGAKPASKIMTSRERVVEAGGHPAYLTNVRRAGCPNSASRVLSLRVSGTPV